MFQDFTQNLFIVWCIERLGFFYATTIGCLSSFTTPPPCVFCRGQAGVRAFDTGNAMGLGTTEYNGCCCARGAVRLCCGLRKPPGALSCNCHISFLLCAWCHAACQILKGILLAKSCYCFYHLFSISPFHQSLF
jgi:hypothetical protein